MTGHILGPILVNFEICHFLGGFRWFGYLGHFLLDFFGQIRAQGTLRNILGPVLVIFKICYFLVIPGPFEYFSENGWSHKSFLNEGVIVTPLISLVLGGEVLG